MMSDTHSHHHDVRVPDGDILIHAGDFSLDRYGQIEMKAAYDFFGWLGNLPHKHKILVAGNHDFVFEKSVLVAKTLHESITYLEGDYVTVEGLKIWGGPWTPRFFDWAFNVDRGEAIARYWSHIPKDTDVVVTHGPPAGILDVGSAKFGSQSAGCVDLAYHIKRVKPQLHVFGHFHPSYGVHVEDDTTYVNASVVNEKYELAHEPRVIEL